MSSIQCLYRTQSLINIFAPVTDVTWYSSKDENTSAGHKNTNTFKVTKFELCKIPTFFLKLINRLIVPVGRVFTNGPGDKGSIQGRVIPKTFKMVLDTSLLNTQQYKVRIKGKVEQSRERSSVLPYTTVK